MPMTINDWMPPPKPRTLAEEFPPLVDDKRVDAVVQALRESADLIDSMHGLPIRETSVDFSQSVHELSNLASVVRERHVRTLAELRRLRHLLGLLREKGMMP